jgi:hypothetical protein
MKLNMNFYKTLLIVSFVLGMISGVWMLSDTSQVQTIIHTIELKHAWVRLERLVVCVVLMLIATFAAHNLNKKSKNE